LRGTPFARGAATDRDEIEALGHAARLCGREGRA
jgi:hypothetical protein